MDNFALFKTTSLKITSYCQSYEVRNRERNKKRKTLKKIYDILK